MNLNELKEKHEKVKELKALCIQADTSLRYLFDIPGCNPFKDNLRPFVLGLSTHCKKGYSIVKTSMFAFESIDSVINNMIEEHRLDQLIEYDPTEDIGYMKRITSILNEFEDDESYIRFRNMINELLSHMNHERYWKLVCESALEKIELSLFERLYVISRGNDTIGSKNLDNIDTWKYIISVIVEETTKNSKMEDYKFLLDIDSQE